MLITLGQVFGVWFGISALLWTVQHIWERAK